MNPKEDDGSVEQRATSRLYDDSDVSQADPLGESGGPTEAAGEMPVQLTTAVVVAVHFLRYDDRRSLDPLTMVKSLAYQLALRCAASSWG